MTPRDLITLSPLARGADAALTALRVGIGAFLVFGVWDNITSAEHMREFAAFLGQFGFPWPNVLAPFDVGVQFAIGMAFVLGLMTRWAGLLCAVNFVVAIVMVDHHQGWRGSFGSMCLVLIGLYLATRGPGPWSLDALLFRRRRGFRT
ncbi:DoxX family protein [Phenylobacterium sp. J367]|uniref:DoxX family protein n=1 Tax=Phenylobacterium sp. J367 TaxID=2898435 RepID=UPI002151A731|nr:DoxX family protein [Phenylobacterium sp. J367]MCR5878873.1 DoxX family protein [Phenylobacterium sp. J367]